MQMYTNSDRESTHLTEREAKPLGRHQPFVANELAVFFLFKPFNLEALSKMESSSVYLSLPASKERLYDYSQAMDWPYQFVTLSEADRHKRRILNDQYGLYAHLSPLVPIFGLLLVRLIRWRLRKLTDKQAPYDAEATSSAVAFYEASVASSPLALWRQFSWWLSDNVEFAGLALCRRDQLIFGGAWAAWLLFLCTNDTGTGMNTRRNNEYKNIC